MSKRARPPELEGIGVDGLPYQVKQDGKATKSGRKYRIFFGPGLRGAIRFPPGQELTHENTITALRRRASNSGQRPNLSTPAAGTAAAAAPATRDAAVVAEGHTFVGPAALPADRSKSVPDRFEPEGRAHRNHAQERNSAKVNAAAAEKKRAVELELANDNKRLHAENENLQRRLDEVNADVLGRYAKAASEALMENLEDSGHSDEVHLVSHRLARAPHTPTHRASVTVIQRAGPSKRLRTTTRTRTTHWGISGRSFATQHSWFSLAVTT